MRGGKQRDLAPLCFFVFSFHKFLSKSSMACQAEGLIQCSGGSQDSWKSSPIDMPMKWRNKGERN